jgi:hypothetical protein
MLAHRFTTKQIEELVGTGHALVDARNMRAGGRMVAVRRLRITAAGRLALRGMTQPPARGADALTLKPPSRPKNPGRSPRSRMLNPASP